MIAAAFAGAKLRSARGAFRSLWQTARLRLIAGSLTAAVFVAGAFLLFRALFSYLHGLEDPSFGAALVQRLLATALLAFSVFLGISSVVTGVSTLFRSVETRFLLACPVPAGQVGVLRSLESWFYAGWATLLIGMPMLVAHALTWPAGPMWLLPLAATGFLCFVLCSVSAGSILLFVLTSLGSIRRVWKALAGLVVLLGAGAVIILAGTSPSGVVIGDESGTSMAAIERFIAGLPAAGGMIWPHQLFSSFLAYLSLGNPAGAAAPGAILLLETVALCGAALLLVHRRFGRRFALLSTEDSRGTSSRLMLRGEGGPMSAMIQKDVLLFLRDPVQYSQLALLAGLFLVYAANLDRFQLDVGDPMWRGVLVFLNISFSGFVMATLLVRFAFPAVSLESPGLHALLSVPGGRRLLYWSKWLPAFLLLFLLLQITGYFSALSMGSGPVLIAETLISTGILCLVLVSINVGLGAVFPEFRDNNAARIASGQGGITSAFASMGFVLLVVSVLSIVTRAYMVHGFCEAILLRPLAWTFGILLPVAVLGSVLVNRGALRSLARRDF
ncbi:hypothetical protein JW921_04490 [Candidatus Fermentibacterales bacterium]|nr:hypothetical protein [Candidatus Fermentibacterales bacterium]